MKRILCFFLILLLLTSHALADGDTAWVVNPNYKERLNLRVSPLETAPSLGKYYTGAEVLLLGEEENGYVHVSVGGIQGWMDKQYLSQQQPESAMVRCTVANGEGQGGNLRVGPGLEQNLIRLYPNGTAVTVLGVWRDDWCHVDVDGETGYMMASLLSTRVSFDSTDQRRKEPGSMYVTTNSRDGLISMYTSPDESSETAAFLLSGNMVVVQEFTPEGWALVWDMETGWIRSEHCVPLNAETVDRRIAAQGLDRKGFTVYEKPDGKVFMEEKPGTVFHVEGVLPSGWAMGWSENAPFGYVRLDALDTELTGMGSK